MGHDVFWKTMQLFLFICHKQISMTAKPPYERQLTNSAHWCWPVQTELETLRCESGKPTLSFQTQSQECHVTAATAEEPAPIIRCTGTCNPFPFSPSLKKKSLSNPLCQIAHSLGFTRYSQSDQQRQHPWWQKPLILPLSVSEMLKDCLLSKCKSTFKRNKEFAIAGWINDAVSQACDLQQGSWVQHSWKQ